MLTDFREASPRHIDCDVCVVGAGAAGIAIALRLDKAPFRVCLIESGGLEFDQAVQSLYEGESVGRETASPMGCRLRYFGGTTNHWQGWCAPFEANDFEVRDWVPHSGWPISKKDLDPYYAAAQQILELGAYRYEHGQFPIEDPDVPTFEPNNVRVRYWQYSPPTRFGDRYREQLQRSAHVEVILNANLIRIQTNPSATGVEMMHVQSLSGQTGTVRARAYVLACGAMENTRLLLQTRDVQTEGLGNGSGNLGRYFMQHPERAVGSIMTNQPEALLRAFDRRRSEDGFIRAHLTCSAAGKKRNRLLNAGFDIAARRDFGPGYAALRDLRDDFRDGRWPADIDDKFWSVLTDLDGHIGDLYRRARGEISVFELVAHSEQAPNPASRISLTNERDSLGMPKLKVDWRLASGDKQSMFESTLRIGEELARLRLGRLQLHEWLLAGDDFWPDPIWSGCHHIGTTRMSDEPRSGVVDRNCRMHGVSNLYVAGSSVFPTGSYVTPTLTIVALALRIADHVKGELLR